MDLTSVDYVSERVFTKLVMHYAVCTYYTCLHTAFLLYLSWYDFVGRNMNRHRKFACGNGVGMGMMFAGTGCGWEHQLRA